MIISANAIRPGTYLAVFLAALCGIPRPVHAIERNWVKSFKLLPGGTVSVENVYGNILVEGWDRAEVQASIAMRSPGPTGRLDDIQVAVEAQPGTLAFHTLYPADQQKPVRVDYRLRVPRQVRLETLSTLQGAIAVREVEGSVKARSLHGDINGVNVTGSVEARALTGNILVSLRALPDPNAHVKLETINGNLDLLVPGQTSADLELTTVAGKIQGKFPVQVSAVPGDSTRRARLGEGGAHFELRTVRGNITVGERDEEL